MNPKHLDRCEQDLQFVTSIHTRICSAISLYKIQSVYTDTVIVTLGSCEKIHLQAWRKRGTNIKQYTVSQVIHGLIHTVVSILITTPLQ